MGSSIQFSRVALKEQLDSTELASAGWSTLQCPGFDDLLAQYNGLAGMTELTGPQGLGGVTRLALSLVGAIQRSQVGAWCAWFDPQRTLHAPGVAQAGVDLRRLMVVRAAEESLATWVLRTASRGLFDGVVVDAVAKACDELWVRRLGLVSEKHRTRVLLLTDVQRPRKEPWPVALRLKCEHPEPGVLQMEVLKARHGAAGVKLRLKQDQSESASRARREEAEEPPALRNAR